jgi:hypothetical protein
MLPAMETPTETSDPFEQAPRWQKLTGNDSLATEETKEIIHSQWYTSELCSICQNMCDHWPSIDETDPLKLAFRHHGTRKDLEASAAAGCHLCAQFEVNCYTTGYYEFQGDCWVNGSESVPIIDTDPFTSGIAIYKKPDKYKLRPDTIWQVSLLIPRMPVAGSERAAHLVWLPSIDVIPMGTFFELTHFLRRGGICW